MLGKKTKYKFCLARFPEDVRDISLSFESTWEVIQRSISICFTDKMKGGSIRRLAVSRVGTGAGAGAGGGVGGAREAVGDPVTDATMFWSALVKWYDAASTVFTVYDDSPAELQLAPAQGPSGGPSGGPLAGACEGPSSRVRFCLFGDRAAACTVSLAQGLSFDNIKGAVAGQCSHLAASDIKHFILLDKDGDDFSSGLDTVNKFWRIALKYFKSSTQEFTFNIILNKRAAGAGIPSILVAPAVEVPAPAPAPVPVPAPAPIADVASSLQELSVEERQRQTRTQTQTQSTLPPPAPVVAAPVVVAAAAPVVVAVAPVPATADPSAYTLTTTTTATTAPATAPATTISHSRSNENFTSAAATILPTKPAESLASWSSESLARGSRAADDRPAEGRAGKEAGAGAGSPSAAAPPAPAGFSLSVRLSKRASKTVLPSRRLELMRRREQAGGGDGDTCQAAVTFGCPWLSILDAVCAATGLPTTADISHLLPIVSGGDKHGASTAASATAYGAVGAGGAVAVVDTEAIVDRFQFWAVMRRAAGAGAAVVWEVHVTGQAPNAPAAAPQGPAKVMKGRVPPPISTSISTYIYIYIYIYIPSFSLYPP
jgi:hypothetical protein